MSHIMKKRKPKQEPNQMLQNTDDSITYDDEDESSENYHHKKRSTFYSTLSLWDILIDSSNVTEDDDDGGDDHLSLDAKRLTSVMCNIDELLRKFKTFIAEVCLDSKKEDTQQNPKSMSECEEAEAVHSRLKDEVYVTESLAMILNCSNRKISIANPKRLDSELERCGMIVDSFLELLIIDETEKSTKVYSSTYDAQNITQNKNESSYGELENLSIKHEEGEALSSNLNIWENGETDQFSEMLGSEIPLNLEEIQSNTNEEANDFYRIKKSRRRTNKAGRPKGSKMKPSDSMIGRFRRLGYYPDYCVSEEVYKEAIEKGSPYGCPLCQKLYKERRSLEKHFAGTVNNKCPGVPVEKPTYKLDNGRYYCTQPGCDHEVAIHGAKSMGVIWTHHQSEHLSKDANLPFNCDQCPKAFPLHSILASHIASTHDLKKCSQICDVCGKTIAGSKNKIKQHMLVHTGEKIKCAQCDITFSRPGSLRRHMQHQHNASKLQLHFCDICGKGWKTRSALNVHLESHQTQSQQEQQVYMMQTYNQENG